MKLLPLFTLLSLVAFGFARAEDDIQSAQTELKSQGFYYGEVDGKFTPETSAAIKRFQIRNGLEVTGTMTRQTLESLGLATSPAVTPPALTPPAPPAVAPQPPVVNLRRDPAVQDSDRNFLKREAAPPRPPADPAIIDPPAPLHPPSSPDADYATIFERTPYASAPFVVQQSTLRKAQGLLARQGFYRDQIDGSPGPATEEAVLSYQRRSRLPLTGRLDLQTLSKLGLLPGRSSVPLQRFSSEPRSNPTQRTYRGIWVE